jgi:Dolichyl-phosphate-mannose-protein mannosyltransferase
MAWRLRRDRLARLSSWSFPRSWLGRSGGRGAVLASCGTVLLVVLVAGSRGHPLSPILPPGGGGLALLPWMSRWAGLDALSQSVRGYVGVLALALAGAGFLFALREAWLGRLSLRTVVLLGLAFHAIAVLLPLMGSEDVYLYGMYGRIAGAHHANPYLSEPRLFPNDVFFPFVTSFWRTLRAPYGTAFILLARTITNLTSRPQGVVFSFKLLSAVASVATMLLVADFARRYWPERAPFAAALIALNPAVLFVLVAGGHNDSLVALLLVVALRLRAGARHRETVWPDLASTACLTLATMIKPPLAVVLVALVALSVLRRPVGARAGFLVAHVGVFLAATLPFAAPFLGPHNLLGGLSDSYRLGQYLAPMSFLRTLIALTRVTDVPVLATVLALLIRAGAVLVFVAAFVMILRLAARDPSWRSEGAAIGWILLMVILTGPAVWPWYFAWLLPVAWLLPTLPRLVVVLGSSVLPVLESVAPEFHSGLYDNLVLIGIAVVAPALLALTWFLVKDLISRSNQDLPLWQDWVLRPSETDQPRELSIRSTPAP